MSWALTFPGQGSQAVGMGVALKENFAAAREVFEEVDDALSQNLSGLMADGPEDELTLTENAQTIITGIVDGAQAPQTGGLRIAQDAEGAGLDVTVAELPEADDQVIESAGAKVFLDPSAVVALDDKVLDASATPDGRVDFAIGQQG